MKFEKTQTIQEISCSQECSDYQETSLGPPAPPLNRKTTSYKHIENVMDLYNISNESEEEDDDMIQNPLGQIFAGARIQFDVNREKLQSKIEKVISKREIANQEKSKSKYKKWFKIRGLLNFFLIMRNALFKRKIQGLSKLGDIKNNEPLE